MTTLTQTKDEEDAGRVDTLPMRFLEATFSKNGFTYELVLRDGPFAIYKQRLRPHVGCLSYEVMRIEVKPETTMFGTVVPRREVAPGNESWGTLGWTYPDLPRAKAKLKELIEGGEGKRRRG